MMESRGGRLGAEVEQQKGERQMMLRNINVFRAGTASFKTVVFTLYTGSLTETTLKTQDFREWRNSSV